jgi:hypothetical protein
MATTASPTRARRMTDYESWLLLEPEAEAAAEADA